MSSTSITNIREALKYQANLSPEKTTLRFRGQGDISWPLHPSIHRLHKETGYVFQRYQTVQHEACVLNSKPKEEEFPKLMVTDFDIEWLMLCQHYGVPTRLLDWTDDILIAIYFACADQGAAKSDGAVYICDAAEYPKFTSYNEPVMDTQELAFVETSIPNPRMRKQSGSFMIWGHSPLYEDSSKESYDLWEYHGSKEQDYTIHRLQIPVGSKNKLLNELSEDYGINEKDIYVGKHTMEKYSKNFESLKNLARLRTLYMTHAEFLNEEGRKTANKLFGNIENMFGNCINIRKAGF